MLTKKTLVLILSALIFSHRTTPLLWQEKPTNLPCIYNNIVLQNGSYLTNSHSLVKDFMHESKSTAASIFGTLVNNKYKATGSLILSAYCAISWKLYLLSESLKQKSCWSLWHTETPLEELFDLPQKKLGAELIEELQKTYINKDNPADFIQPLIEFRQVIEQEKKELEQYQQLVATLEKCWLKKYILHDTRLEKSCHERLKRLAYYKACFTAWLTDYKLETTLKNNSQTLPSEFRYLAPIKEHSERRRAWELLRTLEK